jgi:ribosome-associated translation inhibitor RaiA
MNRILVIGNEFISRQARTYAEYRVFSVLTRHTQDFRRARVLLREKDGADTYHKVTCAVTVALKPSGSLRIRVRGRHPYAAINRAVERLHEMLSREVNVDPEHSAVERHTSDLLPLGVRRTGSGHGRATT